MQSKQKNAFRVSWCQLCRHHSLMKRIPLRAEDCPVSLERKTLSFNVETRKSRVPVHFKSGEVIKAKRTHCCGQRSPHRTLSIPQRAACEVPSDWARTSRKAEYKTALGPRDPPKAAYGHFAGMATCKLSTSACRSACDLWHVSTVSGHGEWKLCCKWQLNHLEYTQIFMCSCALSLLADKSNERLQP